MGERDTDGNAIAERRAFVRRLDTHEAVRRVDFTRDGVRTVLVGLEPDVEFRDQWRRTATWVGYTVEQLGTDESPPGWPTDAWILRLTPPDQSTDGTMWWTTVRRVMARIRMVLDRLFGRSNR